MQRLMQALGAYGKLGHADGRAQFLDHIPAALESLREVLERISGTEKLRALLASL
jgi:aminoglycoside/choline kinase family phosphotransferase